MIEHLLKLPHIRIVAGILFIFSSLFAPLLFHYHFNHVFFEKSELFKLIMVCFATGFPMVILNTILAFFAIGDGDDIEGDNDTWYLSAVFGSLLTMLPFFFPMATLLDEDALPLNAATWKAVITQLLLTGIQIIMTLYKVIRVKD